MTEPIVLPNGKAVSADGSAPGQAANGTNGTANANGTHHKQEASSGFEMGKGDLAKLTAPPKFDNVEAERAYLKERLCAALRIFAKQGFDHHVAGHLTVRDPEDPHTFWVNPFGLSFSLMTVSDLIRVNQKGQVIEGGKPGRQIVNLAGFLIHSALHQARPDVNAICHSHSTYGKAFATLGIDLPILTQDAATFYHDIVTLREFGGVVITKSEGQLIAETLQQRNSIILQNHGLLTVGTTIDAAVARFILLENECRVALLAQAAGKPIEIEDDAAALTHKETGSERSCFFLASPYFQVIEHEQGHEYRQ
ncbi:hypothetical protein OIV83_003226 [Microbotryomycetes sp. JL201]|nr:hypothetical protein OIV83_003226 [Microbotryomycetes sp. JL201]